MPLDIHQFPCLKDNYGFLVRDRASGLCASIDTPDPDLILAEAARLGWTVSRVLNTHWHADHAGGNAALKAATGCELIGPEEVRRAWPLDRTVGDGDVVELGETRFDVLGVPGHTLGHIAYHDAADAAAFVGDTIFVLGCGRLFEGDPPTMWRSLSRIAALPEETRLYCAHEYTADNARFALSIDADPVLARRAESIFAERERGEPTVPTTVALERATNPFLRAGDAQAFAAARKAKDVFR